MQTFRAVSILETGLYQEFWIRIGVAVLCGCAIGLERQLRGKPSGMRTSALVCLGSAMYATMGTELATGMGDPTRIVGQIVVGVGFLGGGLILTQGKRIKGITSAATIWMTACIGAIIGLGHFASAGIICGTVLAILIVIGSLERIFPSLRRGIHKANISPEDSPGE